MAVSTDPVTADLAAPVAGDRSIRFVAVRANLLPAEIVTSRAADRMRRNVVVGLAAVVAVLALGFGFSWWQTHSARSTLSSLEAQSTSLNAQTQTFGPLVEAQTRTATIHAQLAQLMTGDLSWRRMLTTLRAEAPAGTVLTNVVGSVTSDSATSTPVTTGPSLIETGQQQVGTLTITGTARDKNAVAAFADQLATVKGLAAPTPTSVASGTGGLTGGASGNGVTFTMSVLITSDALGGRYSTPATDTTALGGN